MKNLFKIIHQISEGILFIFLIISIFAGIKELINYEKDPFLYYIIGASLLIYICFWQEDSVLGKWIHRNKTRE
jgi:hypothetical protein